MRLSLAPALNSPRIDATSRFLARMPISLAALVFVLAIAACNGYDPVAQTRAAAKLPANYREMFAAYIKAEKRYTIL